MSPPVPLVASVVWVVDGDEHIDTVAWAGPAQPGASSRGKVGRIRLHSWSVTVGGMADAAAVDGSPDRFRLDSVDPIVDESVVQRLQFDI